MKEKYYTPSTTEFYEGFEFEMKYVTEGWQKEVFGVGEKAYHSIPQLKAAIKDYKWEDVIRVKYLDPEDIVSAGWERGEENQYGIMFKKSDCKESCRLWYTHLLVITIWRTLIEGGEERIVFQGQIKNLSTLRKIMELVGVK